MGDSKINKSIVGKVVSCLLSSTIVCNPLFVRADKVSDQHNSGDIASSKSVLLKADEVKYTRGDSIVVAKGNVHLVYGNRALGADKIIWNRDRDEVIATGNIWLREPSGDILFADQMVLTDKLKHAAVKHFKVLRADDSRMAAAGATRTAGVSSTLDRAVYSPCDICKTKPDEAPLWQIKAEKAVHDEENDEITYYHARLEFNGVPVFYTPFFRHASPNVKRRSGVLPPRYGSNSDLGTYISVPYFYVIDEHRDATLTAIMTSKQGPVLQGEYRQAFYNGYLKSSASVTQSKKLRQTNEPNKRRIRKNRGHLFADGRYELPNHNRLFILKLNRASDTTYLRRYTLLSKTPTFAQDKNLVSEAQLEEFKDEHYASIKGYWLQTDTPKTTPLVLPLIRYWRESVPGNYGEYLYLKLNGMAVARNKGVVERTGRRTQRASAQLGGKLPYVSNRGDLITANVNVRTDFYNINKFRSSAMKPARSRATARVIPSGSVEWRYPLIRVFDCYSALLEPIAKLIATPKSTKEDKIPNEDSLITELDVSNLFHENRFGGLDRVDEGGRFIYGVRSGIYMPRQRQILFYFGQSIRLDRKQVLPVGKGEDKKASDFVGKVKVKPNGWLSFAYRANLDRKNLSPRISEFSSKIGRPRLKLTLSHSYIRREATLDNVKTSQINWGVSSQLNQRWKVGFGQSFNLNKRNNGSGSSLLAMTEFENQCFLSRLSFFRTRYRDRDIRPNSGVLLSLTFKTLGSVKPLGSKSLPVNIPG